ncbi:MAG: hypothetical protein U0640_10600 [Phycisphaerales bacterium]
MLQPDAVRAVLHQRPPASQSPPPSSTLTGLPTQSTDGVSATIAPATLPGATAQSPAIPRSFTLPLPGPDRTLVDPRPGMALANQRSNGPARPQVDPSLANDLPRLWAKLLEVSQDNRRMRVVLGDLTPVSLHELVLTLRPAPSALLAAKSQQSEIETQLLQLVGKRVAIDLIEPAPQETAISNAPTVESVSAHPLIAQAVELLGGKVIGVQPRRKP